MDNKWTLERLENKLTGWKNDIIEATGSWNDYKECWDINTSDILTRLIQVAGRLCERYASDLFISWKQIENILKDYEYSDGKFLFGFRKDGVDHTEYILNRLNDGTELYYYREMWLLEIKTEDKYFGLGYSGKITFTLKKIYV